MDQDTRVETQENQPKLLQVYEAVVLHGPISLDCAFPLIRRSRSATFRALKTLEKSGWIRRTLNGHQYVATSVIDGLSASGAISLPELDLLCSLLSKYRKQHKLRIQAGFYITVRSFHLLECSESKTRLDLVLCPTKENISCAAFSILPKARQNKILTEIDAGLDLIARDQLRVQVRQYRSFLLSQGYIVEACGTAAYIGLTTPDGQYGALSVAPSLPQQEESAEMHAKAILKILTGNALLP